MDESTAAVFLSLILAAFVITLVLMISFGLAYYFCGHRCFHRRVSLIPTLIHHDHPISFNHLSCRAIGCQPHLDYPIPMVQMPPPNLMVETSSISVNLV